MASHIPWNWMHFVWSLVKNLFINPLIRTQWWDHQTSTTASVLQRRTSALCNSEWEKPFMNLTCLVFPLSGWKKTTLMCPGTTIHFLQWDQWFTTWSFPLEVSSSWGKDAHGSWPNTTLLLKPWKHCWRSQCCNRCHQWWEQNSINSCNRFLEDSLIIFYFDRLMEILKRRTWTNQKSVKCLRSL